VARIEKTVFISYRRKDISWALAVYQYLTKFDYDVFFDYTSISSGDFEQIIVSNIKARAHFVLVLTPTALDRTSNPGDWLRREIETAIDEKRNIIPLLFDDFNFGSPSVAEKLTGKMASISRYNGLDIPSGYFPEAMERLRTRYLNVPLDAVLHPISTKVRKVVKEEKDAANKALQQRDENIQELVKSTRKKPEKRKRSPDNELQVSLTATWKVVVDKISTRFRKIDSRRFGVGLGILLISVLGIFGVNWLIQNLGAGETLEPTRTRELVVEFTQTFIQTSATGTTGVFQATSTPSEITLTKTVTIPPVTPTPRLRIGSFKTGRDGMTLLYVPAGEFIMGSEDGANDERPAHTVYLDAFWIDKTEVTNGMYAQCVNADYCHVPYNVSFFSDTKYSNHPVVYVQYYNAVNYCSWVNRRLPTEAEWEKAARGESAFIYPWGDDSPNNDLLNYSGIVGGTTEVSRYPDGASPYGALDMGGNVLEWIKDLYEPDYYVNSPLSNPLGPQTVGYPELRGYAEDLGLAQKNLFVPLVG